MECLTFFLPERFDSWLWARLCPLFPLLLLQPARSFDSKATEGLKPSCSQRLFVWAWLGYIVRGTVVARKKAINSACNSRKLSQVVHQLVGADGIRYPACDICAFIIPPCAFDWSKRAKLMRNFAFFRSWSAEDGARSLMDYGDLITKLSADRLLWKGSGLLCVDWNGSVRQRSPGPDCNVVIPAHAWIYCVQGFIGCILHFFLNTPIPYSPRSGPPCEVLSLQTPKGTDSSPPARC